jgi:serine/threonine protein phosphatase PrpC
MSDAAVSGNLEEACDALIRAALNSGGIDNTTAILLRVVP